jgi:hypothetical protein
MPPKIGATILVGVVPALIVALNIVSRPNPVAVVQATNARCPVGRLPPAR